MTDEEMAEEYAKKECCITCKNINHFCKDKCECWVFAKKGFLAGLELGRPKWHKVADGDLPNCEHGHTVFNQDLDRVIIRNGRFEHLDGYPIKVVAWCEIPKFEG